MTQGRYTRPIDPLVMSAAGGNRVRAKCKKN